MGMRACPDGEDAEEEVPVRLSEKQFQALEYIAQGNRPRPPFKRPTVESLARHHLVEHTSLGWHLTEFGRTILEQSYRPFGNRARP
jgi:hypothetical protein